MWLFNPSIRISCSSPSPPAPDQSIRTLLGSSSSTRSLTAVKIFYLVVEDPQDPVWFAPLPSPPFFFRHSD